MQEYNTKSKETLKKVASPKTGRQHGTRSSAKPSNDQNKTEIRVEGAMLGDIVFHVVSAVQPMITEIVKAAVTASTEHILTRWEQATLHTKAEVAESLSKVKKEIQLQKFESDKLQQYTRRDNIRVQRIPEPNDGVDDTNQAIVDLAADMGIDNSTNDISTSHRVGSSRQRPGQAVKPKDIIVRFVRRDVKTKLMKNKKNLKNVPSRKNVYLNEDLTPLRGKIMT